MKTVTSRDGTKLGWLQKWSQKKYTCENLTYNMPQLLWSCFLILLGFFAYTFAMAFVPQIIPLKLKALGASNKTIVFIMSSIGQIFNITICPMVSFQSDRYRSKRWGRRVPFILYTLPMMCATWLLFAFVDKEAELLQGLVQKWFTISPATLTVILIGIIMLLHKFFVMYVGSVIYYIYNDTVPAQFQARMVGAVNITTQCASACFNFFIFKHGLTHFSSLLILITVVYTVGVGIMCLLLEEPRFPEPDPVEKRKSSGITAFLKESYSHPFYWYAYLAAATTSISGAAGTFMVFLRIHLGLDLEMIGKLNGYSGIFATICGMVVVGIGTTFIDRWHPVRVAIIGNIFIFIINSMGTKWLFFTPPATVIWPVLLFTAMANQIFHAFKRLSGMPMLMRIFPKSRFGQLCGAQAMFRSLSVLLFSFTVGVLMDFLRNNLKMGDFAYRYIYVWQVAWALLSTFFYMKMYREWQKLGGLSAYKAPAPWLEEKFEPMPVTEIQAPSTRLVNLVMYIFDFIIVAQVITAAFFGAFSNYQGLEELSRSFYFLTVPVTLVTAFIWFVVRLGISRDLRLVANKLQPKNGIPHHGLLIVVAISQCLLLGVNFYQSYALLDPSQGTLAARMYAYEMLRSILTAVGIYIYAKVEKGFSENAI